MFSLLLHAKEIIRVDYRVLAGIRNLSPPPLLSPSQLGEEFFLYLAVSPTVVSIALIREEERV